MPKKLSNYLDALEVKAKKGKIEVEKKP